MLRVPTRTRDGQRLRDGGSRGAQLSSAKILGIVDKGWLARARTDAIRHISYRAKAGAVDGPLPVLHAPDEVVKGCPFVTLVEGLDVFLVEEDKALVHARNKGLVEHPCDEVPVCRCE